MSLRFKDAQAVLAQDVLGFCKKYLPKGQQKGQWWIVSCPWRADKNPSLGVHLTSGRWKDFARGDRGDMIDLAARCWLKTPTEIVRELAP